MVKRITLLTFSLFLLKGYAFGQACTPDPQYTNPDTQRGTYPDTTTNFVPAYAASPYAQTVTIVVPPDTTFLSTSLTWDSTVLTGVTGLPPGFTYSCTNTSPKPYNCSWKGNSIGCAIITGSPTAADIGTYPLQFALNNYLGGNTSPIPFTAKGYRIVINPANSVSEHPMIQIIQQNNPNPFDDKSEILFTAEGFGTAQFKVYNMIGNVIQEFDISVKQGINKLMLDAKDFESGVYFYALVSGSNAFTRKMIVKK